MHCFLTDVVLIEPFRAGMLIAYFLVYVQNRPVSTGIWEMSDDLWHDFPRAVVT